MKILKKAVAWIIVCVVFFGVAACCTDGFTDVAWILPGICAMAVFGIIVWAFVVAFGATQQ